MEQITGDSKRVLSRSELHSLLVNQLNHVSFTTTEDAILQATEEILIKAFCLGFQATITGMKSSSSRNMKIFLMNMIHNADLEIMKTKSFDLLSPSDAFVDALKENVLRHSTLAQNPFGPMSRTTIKHSKTE